MGSFRVPVARSISAGAALSQVPSSAKPFLRSGYSTIAKASGEQREMLVQYALESVEEGPTFQAEEIGRKLGVPESDAENALGATMFLTSFVTGQSPVEDADKLAQEMIKAGVMDPTDRAPIAGFAISLQERAQEIRGRLDRASLAIRALPAFQALRTAVDVRLGFGERKLAVPIGLLHLETDEETDIHLQVTAGQLARIIKRLQDLQSQLAVAQDMARGWERQK